MSTYYVATTGNDTTGNGSSGNRWATISKAIATIAAGDIVVVGSGTYAESTGGGGFFSVTRIFASDVTIQNESGNAANVVITGASNATYNTLIQWGSAHVYWKNLTFAMRLGTNAHAIRVTEALYHTFDGCRIVTTSDAGGVRIGVNLLPSGSTAIANFTFLDCVWVQTGGYNADALYAFSTASGPISNLTITRPTITAQRYGIAMDGNTAGVSITGGTLTSASSYAIACGGTLASMASNWALSGVTATGSTGISISCVNGLTVTNCTATGTVDGLKVIGSLNAVTTGGTFTGGNAHGLEYGVDGETGDPVTGSITGATVSASTGHGLLIGAGCSSVTVTGCIVSGGDHAIVIKECTGAVVTGCNATGEVAAVGSALYFKGATGATATGNTLRASRDCVAKIGPGGTGHASSGITVTDNAMEGYGPAKLLNYSGSTITSNRNIYRVAGTGNIGTANGTSGITRLPDLVGAWSGYTPSGNDAASRILARVSPWAPLLRGRRMR